MVIIKDGPYRADIWVSPMCRYWPKWLILSASVGVVVFLTHLDNLRKKAQWTKSRQLSCSNTSSYVFINKHTTWTMKHALAIATK